MPAGSTLLPTFAEGEDEGDCESTIADDGQSQANPAESLVKEAVGITEYMYGCKGSHTVTVAVSSYEGSLSLWTGCLMMSKLNTQ